MVRIVLRAKGGHVREGSCVVCWWGFNYSTLERRVEVKTILVYLPPFEGNRNSGGTDLGHMLLQWREQLKIVSLIASSWACFWHQPQKEFDWVPPPPHQKSQFKYVEDYPNPNHFLVLFLWDYCNRNPLCQCSAMQQKAQSPSNIKVISVIAAQFIPQHNAAAS